MAIQDRWAWCNKCQALSFAGGISLGACPAGGEHNHAGSGNYALVYTEPTVPGQDNWRWCEKCQALAFGGHDKPGKCSAGGLHDHSGSVNYNLLGSGSGAKGQLNWQWCNKCEVMSFAGSPSAGKCAAGGLHDHTGSGGYILAQVPDCRPLLKQVESLNKQIEKILNSSGYIDPKTHRPDHEMFFEVKALEDNPAHAAYLQCEANKPKLLDELRLLRGNRHFGPVPLWVMGHNTNSIKEIHAALDQGANAVEVDVTAYAHDLNALCIDHAGITGDDPGHANAPAFEPFLHDLRKVVDSRPKLAMVMFDLKPPASRPDFGPVLMSAIRNILTKGNHLSIILSVGDVTSSQPYHLLGSSVFDDIRAGLGPHEGFMIDADNDPDGVAGFFVKAPGVTRFGYGNGTSFDFSDEGMTNYRTPIEKACWMREALGRPGFVDAWTVNSVGNLTLYLRLGVNGLICDPQGIERVRTLLQQSEFSQRYRMAQRFDDPMVPDNFAYGLTVKTAGDGTDATITFTLTGDKGSASTKVDTNFTGRMEDGLTNFVVLHSADLGNLKSITVQSDMAHNAPEWQLDTIVVESHRYGGKKTASFKTSIKTTNPVARNLA